MVTVTEGAGCMVQEYWTMYTLDWIRRSMIASGSNLRDQMIDGIDRSAPGKEEPRGRIGLVILRASS